MATFKSYRHAVKAGYGPALNPMDEPEFEAPNIPFEDWEIDEWMDAESSYTWSVKVIAEYDGIEYSAIGTAEAGSEELTDVDESTIEEV